MKKIPTVMTYQEILDKAFKKANKIDIRDIKGLNKSKSESISRLNAFAHTISSKLKSYVKTFPSMDNLHPFYNSLIDLLVGVDDLKHSLGALDWAAKRCEILLREFNTKIKRAKSRSDIERLRKSAYGRISSVVKRISKNLELLTEARKVIKKIPGIDLESPLVVVAGSPNVGKSLIVEKLTSAKPKIAPYPFTTQGISIGHLEHKFIKVQFVDTPGLLDRPLEERNSIERQAILAIEHIADLIVFVFDASETCGYTLESQKNLLDTIKGAFPNLPMILVSNKSDVISEDDLGLSVSALKNTGMDELKKNILATIDEIIK